MRNHSLARAALALALALPSVARAGDVNVVRSIEVTGDETRARVIVSGSKAPTFTVFRLDEPARLIVDLAGADITAVRGLRDGRGPVDAVTASQFSDENATVGRVVVAISNEARYDVRAEGNGVVIAVTAPPRGEQASQSAPEPAAKPAAEVPASAVAEKAPAPQIEPAPAVSSEPGVLAVRRDEKEVAGKPAKRILSASTARKGSTVTVNLAADGEIGTFEALELAAPPRLALDLFGLDKAPRERPQLSSPVRDLRFGKHDGKVRAVLEFEGESLPPLAVERSRRGLTVVVNPKAPPAVAVAQAKPAAEPSIPAAVAPAPARVAAVPAAAPAKLASVKDVTFKGDQAGSRVAVAVAGKPSWEVSRPDPRTAVLTLSGANIPKRLERSLDTSAFGGPVKMVSSFAAPGGTGAVQVVATLEGEATDSVRFDERTRSLVWEFSGPGAAPGAEIAIDGKRISVEESASAAPRTSGFAAESATYAASGARKPKYVGRRVSFEFKDIEIHNLLRIIAEVSKRNIVVADNVGGRVTIRLRNVPWDQALDIILKTKGLDKEEFGNIIRIAPLKDLEEERKIAAQAEKDRIVREPLKVRLIPVNYATAGEVSGKVKDVLSERGSMTVDDRTNVIIVKDTLEALARAEGLVRRLDTQTPQVLIESRIVEANTSFSREFGIQWGGDISLSPATGNPTGLLFPSILRVAGGSSSDANAGTADVPNFAVNMPAPVGTGAGGGVGFVFGSAGGAVALNLRLTAMENAGQVKTIAAPKITTLDNNAATIGQGVAIPFSQAGASGVNTSFVEAKLELKVTPHVTADGSVLLNIQATNNQPDQGLTGANGQPSISKKEAKTQVLVKDGDTTVIGGIYTRSQSMNEASVPVLSKVPVLGWLFKKQRETDNRTELLIFITPRIVNRNQLVSASDMGAQ